MTPVPRLRPRLAIAIVFALHGMVTGNFATRVPWLQEHRHLGNGGLGLALLMPAIGAVSTMPFAGRLVHAIGGRSSVRLLLPAWCACLALPSLMPSTVTLFLVLFVYGACAGTCDVAMNERAVHIEAALGRPIMSGLHGLWSVGALVGSGLGALAAAAGVDARVHLGIVSIALVLAAVWVSRQLPADGERALAAQAEDPPPLFALPGRDVLLIGLVGFGALFAEGSSADWCAVFLRDVLHAGGGVAALGYTAFALTMTAGRLVGDRVVARLGASPSVRVGGVIATVGTVMAVVAPVPAVAIVGFALMGLGTAVVVPLCFAAAGHAGTHAGQGIAGVATLAYGAGLAAPASIGGLAAATSLRGSFLLIAAMTAMVAIAAGALKGVKIS